MTIKYKELQKIVENKHKTPLLSIWDATLAVPPQSVLITNNMLSHFAGHSEVDSQAIIDFAVADTTGAVTSEFTSTSLNSINSLYYSSCEYAFHKHSDLANLFVSNRIVQRTVLMKLLEEVASPLIRIKEICCGGTFTRWQHFSEFLPKDRSLDVTLADLTKDIIQIDQIQALSLPRMTFHSESYDLRDDFKTVSPMERFDALFVTYGFDSVWLPEDVMYYKKGAEWFQILYRVKVLPSPHQERVIQALREGYVRPMVPLADFDSVVIECIAQKIPVDALLFKDELLAVYGNYNEMRINVPATLVKRVEEAFESQLKDSGIFMIGEVAVYVVEDGKEIETTIADYNTTGKVGKYKVEDFWLAEYILKRKGFVVEVWDLGKLAKRYGKEVSEDTEDTWVMVVKR
jgi:hypothetical protein